MGRCPFHGDRSPSFSVNRDFYYCFGCKETGDAISLMTKLHGLSFEEAIEDLAEKANLKIPESTYASSADEQAMYQRRLRLQKGARLLHFASIQYYHQNLAKPKLSPQFAEAVEYLKKRGITQQTIENFQVGVAGYKADGLVQFLTEAKAPLDLAREAGLIRPSQKQAGDYDFFRERVLFPLIDVRGRVCGFGGRILPSADKKDAEVKLPKYLNSAESEYFQKSKFLYGLYQAKRAIREEESVIVVEGYFDVIGMHQYGFQNVVATCGTSLTEDHLKTLSRLAKKIIVFFDQDAAGIGATEKAMEMGLKNGVLFYGIPFEGKLDPDEFLYPDLHDSEKPNTKKMKTWIANAFPLLDQRIDHELRISEGNIEQRSLAVKQITQWLEMFTDEVGRAMRVDQLIQKWRIPPVALGRLGQSQNTRPSNPQPQNRPQSQPHPNAPDAQMPPYSDQGQGYRRNPNPQYRDGRPPYRDRDGKQQYRDRDGRPTLTGAPMPPRRPQRFQPFDLQLLGYFLKFEKFGHLFEAALTQIPEKDSLSDFFYDTELSAWVSRILKEPAGLSQLKAAPDTLVSGPISQELQSVIMESLLQDDSTLEEAHLEALLKKGIHKIWVRFSHDLKRQMAQADASQDSEKFKELSQQFLDLQRKLKEFEGSYVSGN